jgi:hypothetical protein
MSTGTDPVEAAGAIPRAVAAALQGRPNGEGVENLSGVDHAAIDATLPGRKRRSRKPGGPARAADSRAAEKRSGDLRLGRGCLDREWRGALRQAENLPAVFRAVIALDSWNELSVLQHAPWIGRLLAASILRQAGITNGAHLAAINLGLKTIPVDRRRHRDRETRLLAIAHGLIAAAEIGLKEHDRLALARTMMERKLEGRGASSKLPELVVEPQEVVAG